MTRFSSALLLAFLAVPAAAQQTPPTRTLPPELRDGRDALSFGASLGGGNAGWTHMTSNRTAFTLFVSAYGNLLTGEAQEGDSLVATRDNVFVVATIAPGFRRYLSGRGEVASYFAGHVELGVEGHYTQIESEEEYRESADWTPLAGVGGGVGLEWFVTDQLSLSGQIGGRVSYSYAYQEYVFDRVIEERQHIVRFNLGSTGLAASLWF